MLAATLATLGIVSICYLLPGLCGDRADVSSLTLLQYCTVITRLTAIVAGGTVALLSSE